MDINTDPWCCWEASHSDSDMSFSDSSGWDFTIAPGGKAGHSQQAASLYPRVSSSVFLHVALAAPLLLLSSVHHILAHCGCSCCRLTTRLAGLWVTACGNQVSMAHLCLSPVGDIVVRRCVSVFLFSCVVLCVYGLFVLWGRGEVCV